ncbi:unnamed protein product, partial [Brassica rapa subsp. narinosa]
WRRLSIHRRNHPLIIPQHKVLCVTARNRQFLAYHGPMITQEGEAYGFVVWIDKERQCLWQKRSLLEARDKMRRQTHDINALREALDKANAQVTALEVSRITGRRIEFLKAVEELLKQNVNDSDKKFRRFVVSSWGGFLVAAAVLVYALKM